jgi:hypothetical protein
MIFNWMISMHASLKNPTKNVAILTGIYAAQDLLMRDLYSVPIEMELWKDHATSQLIWHAVDKDIGWLLEHEQLYRIEGTFNVAQATWSEKTRSLVADEIRKCKFELNTIKSKDKTYVTSISCMINESSFIVTPRNRVWYEKIV